MGDELTFHVVAASADRIRQIQRMTGRDTAQEVISDALRTYESLVLHNAKGTRFQAILRDGSTADVEFLFEPEAPRLVVIKGGRDD